MGQNLRRIMFALDTRYSKVLQNWADDLETGTVLEVGFGFGTIGSYLKDSIVVNIGMDDVISKQQDLEGLNIDGIHLEFQDSSFDYVICRNMLEYLTNKNRIELIDECIRVAKKKCFIQGPHGGLASIGEDNLQVTFKNLSHNFNSDEKRDKIISFPNASMTIDTIFQNGYESQIFINEGLISHCSAVLLDEFYSKSDMFYKLILTKTGLANCKELDSDIPFSLLFVVNKDIRVKDVKNDFLKLKNRKISLKQNISIFNIFHEPKGIEDKFKLLTPFFTKKREGNQHYTIEEPLGFFEENNDRCSELSAIHNIWKRKLYLELVGICHYRRYLYLYPDDIDGYQKLIRIEDFESYQDKIESKERIISLLNCYDLIISRPRDNLDGLSVENHYCVNHYAEDYYKCNEIILKLYPYLEPDLIASMESSSLYSCNLLYCESNIFDNFCKIWFDILTHYSKEVDPCGRTVYQTRDVAFLSERVFDVLIRNLKRVDYKILELPILFIEF